MPGQDEFAPLARQWTSVHDRFLADNDPRKIADEAYQILKKMFSHSNGCQTLPALVKTLETFNLAIASRKGLGWQVLALPEIELEASLDLLSRGIDNHRIDAVAVRSCRITAIQLAYDTFRYEDYPSLGIAFTTQMLRHILCHFFLDRARSLRQGNTVDNYKAETNYQQVLESIEHYLRKYAEKLIQDPTGQ